MALRRVSRLKPFQYIGLHYFGPLRVKEGNGIDKMWICLFTCLAVHAVHLELVERIVSSIVFELSPIARRGRPKLIISDNALHFWLVKTTLDMEWNKTVKNNKGIQWSFTTALTLARKLLQKISWFSETKFKKRNRTQSTTLGTTLG